MAASIAVSANPYQLVPVTLTFSGLSITTAYTILVTTPDGSIEDYSATSDGAGGIVVTYVPQLEGSVSVSINPSAPQAVSATTTFTVTGAP